MFFQSRCRLKLLLPYGPMLTETNKIGKNPKFHFTILWTTLVETLPRSMHDFLAVNLKCTFRGDVVWNFFLPYGPMLTKTKKKKIIKIKKNKILEKKKNGLRILWIGTCNQNLVSIYLTVSENLKWCLRTDGRTTTTTGDGRRTPAWQQLLCCAVPQSSLS